MNSVIGSTAHSFIRRLRFHRPYLETLEQRLPPGDTLALLLGGAAWGADSSVPNSGSGTYLRETPFRVGEGCETEFRVLNVPKQEFGNEDNADSTGTAANYSGTRGDADLDWLGNDSAKKQRIVSNPESSNRPLFMDAGSSVAAPGIGRTASASAVTWAVAGRAPIQAAFNAEKPVMPDEQPADVTAEQQAQVQENYGRLPISFEANHGQVDDQVDFIARGAGYNMFLTPTEAVMVLEKNSESRIQNSESVPDWRAGGVNPLETAGLQGVDTPRSPESAVVRMQFVGANPNPAVTGQDQLPGIVNYFIGNDPTKWHTDIPTYAKVEYDEVYPGIDLVYYGNAERQLEYDFVVAPGADPRAITLNFAGADKLEVDAGGDLIVHAGGVELRQHKPVLYQETGGTRQDVNGNFALSTQHSSLVTFDVGAYDADRPLVIDPILGYSTYLGGSGFDSALAIAVDATGSAYVTGGTDSPDFPAQGFDGTYNNFGDAFLAKLDPAGTALVYATYLGGAENSDYGDDIAVDAAGNAYVTGFTRSPDFPTQNAYQPNLGAASDSNSDAFITKLNPAGNSLAYSTYLGGDSDEAGLGIVVGAEGTAFVTGFTGSNDFPTTPGAYDSSFNGTGDAFVAKLTAAGNNLTYSTYLGGSSSTQGFDIDVSADGSAYVTGITNAPNFPTTPGAYDTNYNGPSDAFVAKLNSSGNALAYASYLGGSDFDWGNGIAVDAAGSAYVTGATYSTDFLPQNPPAPPWDSTLGGSVDAYVTKFNAAGTGLVYSTFLGGSETDTGFGIAAGTCGEVYVAGYTYSPDFPTVNSIHGHAGFSDTFVTKLGPAGNTLSYSTYLGGSDLESQFGIGGIAVGADGNAYVTGDTNSADFPVTAAAYDRVLSGGMDAFVTKVVFVTPPTIPSDHWTAKGPAPILGGQTPGSQPVSGRIAGIAPHSTDPNTIYVGAASGGVWKTHDAGTTWASLMQDLPLVPADKRTLVIGAIALAPSDPDVIYAGTGEATNSAQSYYGRGILKSSNGGASWNLLGTAEFDRKTIARIVVHPLDPNTVYAAVANSFANNNGASGNTGIWRSTDGGTTWTNTTTAITSTFSFSDLLMHPNNPNLLYAAVGHFVGDSKNGVYRSRNGGQTWSALGNFPIGDTNGRINLAIAPSAPNVMYAAVVSPTSPHTLIKFLKTTTGGRIWNEIPNVPNYLGFQGQYDSALIVDGLNPNVVYAGGQGDVIRSADGGASWVGLNLGVNGNGPHADHQAFAFDSNGRLMDGNDGGLWRLDNPLPGSVQWTDLNTNLAITQFNGIALHPTDPNIVYGGAQDNGTNKTTGAQAWNQIGGGDGGFVRVDCANPNTVYHTFFYLEGSATGFFERSDDGGANWAAKTSGLDLTNPGNFYIPYVMDPSNPSRLLLGTDRVYETTDKADTWTVMGGPHQFSNAIDTLEAAASDGNTVYVTARGSMFKTVNHGGSWQQIDIPGATDHFRDLLVEPTDSKRVYAVRDRFNNTNHQGQVFQSTNGGASWLDITANLPDVPANALALDPRTVPATLYVGTDIGVYVSSPSGTWQPFKTGLPPVMVRELELNQQINILAAGTYGRGLWEIGIEIPPPPLPAPPADGRPSVDVARPSPAGAVFVAGYLEPIFRPVRPSETPLWRNAVAVIVGPTVTLSKPIRTGYAFRKAIVATSPELDSELSGSVFTSG